MWRATIKGVLAKKLRLLLTALSIVLGVGFVAGTYVLTDTMNAAFSELFTQATQGVDLVIRSENAFIGEPAGPGGGGGDQREPLDESLVADVAAVNGVAIASGDVTGYAQMVDPASDEVIGGVGPPTIGTNWNELSSGVLELRAGSAPTGGGEVVVDAGTASARGLTVGTELTILFEGPPEEFRIVGIAGFGDADNLGGATLALFDLDTAQRVLGREGVVDTISVQGVEGISVQTLQASVAAALPPGAEVLTGTALADEQARTLQDQLGFIRLVLLVFAAIALFVGTFLIFNTFSIIVAQRTRELALFRTLGASARQVMASVIGEGLIVGVVASIAGIFAGIGIALGLQALLSAVGFDLPSTSTQVQARTLVVAFIVGVGVTVAASILPAIHAARVSPIEALREGDSMRRQGDRMRRVVIGSLLTLAGVAALGTGLFGSTGNAASLVGLGAALTFIGVATLSPMFARPVAGAIGLPFRGRSVSSKIGRENSMRNPRRTASTAAALMIGLGLVAMVAIMAASAKASLYSALDSTLKADLTLSTSSFASFSQDVATRVSELPEVATVSAFRQNGFRVDGQTDFVTAIDPATIDQVASLEMLEGSVSDLAGDTVMVYENVATDRGWGLGDEVPASFPSIGDRPLTVVGIYAENSLAGNYAISLATYEGLYTEQLDAFVLVKGGDGVSTDALQAAVSASLSAFPNVDVQNQAEFRDKFGGFIDQLVVFINALLLFAIIIALFGIVNTLGLSIYERTREIGLLRAVGMGRTQVKRMIRYESVIIALFGALLGIVVGIGFGWALQQALEPEGVTELAIPIWQLVSYLVFAALAGVVAAIWPARRAAKIDVLRAISYE